MPDRFENRSKRINAMPTLIARRSYVAVTRSVTATYWRLFRVLITLVGLLMNAPVSAAETKPRPNVLFLFAYDMRIDSIAALGNTTVKTPHLDSLVRRGFAMRNAYCFGGNSAAVCTPSRNMLLSGNAYFRWKNFVPPGMKNARPGGLAPGDGPNFPLVMRDAGYLTYHHGNFAPHASPDALCCTHARKTWGSPVRWDCMTWRMRLASVCRPPPTCGLLFRDRSLRPTRPAGV